MSGVGVWVWVRLWNCKRFAGSGIVKGVVVATEETAYLDSSCRNAGSTLGAESLSR